MSPRVSVVVPAYNNGPYVEETMDSILGQTFEDFELIVADHESTDDTWERLQRYRSDTRVRFLTTPSGGGAPRNWNRVTAEATGELLKLVCADDLIYPTCLQEQVAAMDAHDGVAMVACKRDIIDARGATVVRSRGLAGLSGAVPGPAAVRATVLAGANIFGEPGCVLVRRELLEKVGGWDESQPFLLDEATYARCLLLGDLYAQPRALAAFRVSATQWSVHLAREQAAHAAEFHRALAGSQPGLLSRRDVLVGNLRAQQMAFTRRLTYRWLGHRMHADATR